VTTAAVTVHGFIPGPHPSDWGFLAGLGPKRHNGTQFETRRGSGATLRFQLPERHRRHRGATLERNWEPVQPRLKAGSAWLRFQLSVPCGTASRDGCPRGHGVICQHPHRQAPSRARWNSIFRDGEDLGLPDTSCAIVRTVGGTASRARASSSPLNVARKLIKSERARATTCARMTENLEILSYSSHAPLFVKVRVGLCRSQQYGRVYEDTIFSVSSTASLRSKGPREVYSGFL
jgi:hypothetical protein